MIAVLDACAMIAYLRNEVGADVVETLLFDQAVVCYAHAINLCEVYYDFLRFANQETAYTAIQDLRAVGLIFSEDMDLGLWQAAGRYKATQRLSLADCFALAFTNRLNGELITSDHHEFDPIAKQALCPIRFFR